MNFEILTGFSFHGLVGIIAGLIIFSLLLFLIRYEKKANETFNFKDSNLNEVGDPIEEINILKVKITENKNG